MADETVDKYGFKEGWWFYLKSFLFNPSPKPTKKEEIYNPEME